MDEIAFTVFGEPCAKSRPRVTKSGHAYMPEKTVAYENLVKLTYMNEVGRPLPYGEQAQVHVEILACMSIPKSTPKKKRELMLLGFIRPTKKPDLDNIIKAVCDALNGLAFRDDSCVTSLKAIKKWDSVPKVVITIKVDAE